MKIPYGKHFIDENDIKEVTNALKKNYITQGPLIESFEKNICKIVKAKYAVAVSSCTAGLHLALMSIKNKNKKKVITSPISFVATANMIVQNNLKPEFVDINLNTLNICSVLLKKNISNKKNILAVIPVHIAGLASESKKIYDMCRKKNIKVIEDAAHSFGGKYYDGSMIGSCKYSDMTVFSFHPVKTITTGEGGVITTNSKKIYKLLLKLRNHGIEKDANKWKNKKIAFTHKQPNVWYYESQNFGFNYRITDFQCALGNSQLKKLKYILNYRKKIALFYDKNFSKINNLFLPQKKDRKLSSNHLYIININFNKLKINKNLFMKKLLEEKIVTQVHYIPIPLHPIYKQKIKIKNFSNAMKYYNEAISLPIHLGLKNIDQKKIIKLIKKNLEKNYYVN